MIALSQVSPGSTKPLPQAGAQSLSVPLVSPAGQQPSLLSGAVIGVVVHIAAQVPPPTSASVVHAMSSLHAVGHEPLPTVMPGSQPSPVSSTPLPQAAAQSLSVLALAPAGQQPSASAGPVISACVHAAVQSTPSRTSLVQATPSSQAAGHAPSPVAMPLSQSSPSSVSTTPSPQVN